MTLLLVAGLQTYSMAFAGHWQISDNNDPFHFVQQLFLLIGGSAGLVAVALGGAALGSLNTILVATCCAIILAVATFENYVSGVGRVARFLGDISYSLYLVHVPIQIIVLIVADVVFGGDRSFAQSHVTLPVYLLCSVGVAYWTHVYFEKPAGQWVRRTLKAKQQARG